MSDDKIWILPCCRCKKKYPIDYYLDNGCIIDVPSVLCVRCSLELYAKTIDIIRSYFTKEIEEAQNESN